MNHFHQSLSCSNCKDIITASEFHLKKQKKNKDKVIYHIWQFMGVLLQMSVAQRHQFKMCRIYHHHCVWLCICMYNKRQCT